MSFLTDSAALTGSVRPQAARPEPSMADVGDYLALLKPRVMSLVVFTALAGLLLAPGSIHPVIGLTAILCIAVGAGASGALNMWYDSDIDRVMTRTAERPVAAGRVAPGEALGFGIVLSVGSVAFLGLMVNLLSAALLAFTIFFYAVIYTMWLKRSTPQNIVIGGAAGAFPPVIGWAAVTNSIDLYPVLMFLIIFMWTPPHFWALSVLRADEYRRAGVPMMPVARGIPATLRQTVWYSAAMIPTGAMPWLLGYAGPAYGIVAVISGLAMLVLSVRLRRAPQGPAFRAAAGRLFGFSLLYLFILFSALLIEWGAARLGPFAAGQVG